jgi:TonB-linked SusC/RagA family outer membrane protein
MKKLSLILFVLFCTVTIGLAQRTVSGSVKDSKGEPIIGASVAVQGTDVGTVTDIDGMFSVSVPDGSNTLLVSLVGFTDKVLDITGLSTVEVSLADGQLLDEVVVTALGIKRDKKALGYATTSISSDEIASRPETDVARAIAGKSPGVTIASSAGLAGSGTKINIRGVSTVSGNSQPLWVVDGVPINASSNETKDFRDGNIAPTRNLDIDPNNIASMSVLRGLSATTLYGSQGRNGVILITTKTGGGAKATKKYSAGFSQSYAVVDAFIPEYQNKWANGFDGDYGEFFSNWGSLFTKYKAGDKTGLRHPYYEHRALFPENPEFASIDGYVPQSYPDNVKDFFRRGNSSTTSFNAGVNGDIGQFNVSFSKLGENGYIKNNELSRNNLSIGGTANISSKLTLNGTFSYVKTDFTTPPVAAGLGSNSDGGPSVFANIFYTPRNINLSGWPTTNPVTKAPIYYRNNNSITNPYWLLDNSAETSDVNRFLTNVSANYKLADWLSLTYRLGLDNFTENQSYHVNKGSVGYPTGVAAFSTGLLRTTVGSNTIQDHNIFLSGNRNLNSDIDLTFNVGVNARKDSYEQTGLESTNQVVFGLVSHRNFINNSSRTLRGTNLNAITNQLWNGAYADLTFGYKNWLYANIQGRNDWTSAHQPGLNSLFYPGFSLSFVPTDAFQGLSGGVLDFLKLRAGYGTSANFASPYNTVQNLNINTNFTVDGLGNVISLAPSSVLANVDLAPELQKELEFGLESKLFNNRVGFDVSYYNRIASDQIISRPLDPSTGYFSTSINAGSITNKGIEAVLSISPIRTKDFDWTLRTMFTKNVSKVTDLPEGSKEINIAGYAALGSFAIEGQPYGVIKGRFVEKNDKGELLVTENGDWKISSETGIIGDPNSDYSLVGFNEFSYKGFTLGGQVEFVKGGDIFSYSSATPIGRGVAKELESFNPELPVILPGVKEDGSPNDIPMPASGVFFSNTIIGGGADDRGIYDATRIRLREVSLTYQLPASIFGSSFVKGANFSIVGNNLYYRTFNTPASSKVDADRTAFGTSNGAGFDFLGGPSARRIGATLKFTF